MKPKKLIVSYDSYSWIKYCSGMIIQNPKQFAIIIVSEDNIDSILDCKNLCKESIYAQRTKDLYDIGICLGVPEITNLGYINESDLNRIVAQLQIKIIMGGISEVYYQNNKLLYSIFTAMKKKVSIPLYYYTLGGSTEIELSLDEYMKKNSLVKYIIGNRNKDEISGFQKIEKFNRI